MINFIVGESGCGKSTFLKLLNQSITPVSGELLYKGTPIDEYDPIALRREVSLVSQDLFLFDESILDNFKTFYSLRQKPMPKSDYINYITELCCVNVPLRPKCIYPFWWRTSKSLYIHFFIIMPKGYITR